MSIVGEHCEGCDGIVPEWEPDRYRQHRIITGSHDCSGLPWREVAEKLYSALFNLRDRVERNGGLGEYKGGPAFVMKFAAEALDAYDRAKESRNE